MAYFPPNDLLFSGTINTQNLNATGVATSGSAVTVTGLNGQATLLIHFTANTLSQVTNIQGTVDGTNWVTLSPVNQQTGAYLTSIGAAQTGVFVIGTVAFNQVRVVQQNAVTGSATVSVRATYAQQLANVNLANVGSGPVSTGQAATSAGLSVALSTEAVQDVYISGQSSQTATVNNILTSTSGSAATDTQQYTNNAYVGSFRSASVQVVSTGTGGTYIFEGSNDNVNFQTLPVFSQNIITGTPIVGTTTASASSFIYIFPINCRYIRLRISATITGGSIQAFTRLSMVIWSPPIHQVAQGTASNLNVGSVTSVTTLTGTTTLTPGTGATNLGKAKANAAGATDTGVTPLIQRTDAPAAQSATGNYVLAQADKVGALMVHQVEKLLKTYSASGVIVPAASATDIAILPGNGTTTVYITKVIVSGIQTTGGVIQVFLAKRSTANTGGTSTSFTVVPHDSGDAAASSTPLNYSANPTSTGTLVGNVRAAYVALGASTVTSNDIVEFNFGDKGKPIILSGTTQGLAVNLNGVTVTGGSIDVTYEWYEL